MNALDTDGMLLDLLRAGVVYEINHEWTAEEVYNYIIHLYDVHIIGQSSYSQLQDIARIVYSVRKFRGHKWIESNRY